MRFFKLSASVGFILAMALPLHATTFAPCGSVPGNVVTNCGFETGLTGWTPQTFYNSAVEPSWQLGYPNTGNYYFWTQEPGGASLSQTLVTSPGTQYTLAFYFSSDSGTALNILWVYWDGAQYLRLVDPSGYGNYVLYTFLVTGTGSDTLEFKFLDENGKDNFGDGLDDVSVSPTADVLGTPEPASLYLLLTGLGLIFLARRRCRV
jgi:PEP-CTERM motif